MKKVLRMCIFPFQSKIKIYFKTKKIKMSIVKFLKKFSLSNINKNNADNSIQFFFSTYKILASSATVFEVNGYCFLLACIILMCWLRSLVFLNDFLHVSHTDGSFQVCICWFLSVDVAVVKTTFSRTLMYCLRKLF